MTEITHGDFAYPFLADRPPSQQSVEGFLMPDTYNFWTGGGAHYAVNRMLRDFAARVPPSLVERGRALYGSFYAAMILASIVQREAGTNEDRGLIASVYVNRLRDASGRFRLLGADPTVQYAVGHAPDWWPRRLTRADLSNPSPYNTYRHTGLPPGPIAEPLLASIRAAVSPPHTSYFYFYHVNGSHGKSIFCPADQPQCRAVPR